MSHVLWLKQKQRSLSRSDSLAGGGQAHRYLLVCLRYKPGARPKSPALSLILTERTVTGYKSWFYILSSRSIGSTDVRMDTYRTPRVLHEELYALPGSLASPATAYCVLPSACGRERRQPTLQLCCSGLHGRTTPRTGVFQCLIYDGTNNVRFVTFIVLAKLIDSPKIPEFWVVGRKCNMPLAVETAASVTDPHIEIRISNHER